MLEETPLDETDGEKKFEERNEAEDIILEVSTKEELSEDMDWETYLSEYSSEWSDSFLEERGIRPFESFTTNKTNLYSHLMWQLNMSNFGDRQKEIGTNIIGNLNGHGYLKSSLEEISQSTGYTPDEVLQTLKLIQQFDPVGIAARDTRECLLIQARLQNLGGSIVEKIILEHMNNLENKKYELIARSLSIPLQEVLSAISIITHFEPKPGRRYSDEETIYISPDIYVFKVGDDYEIVLNEDGLPRLKINSYYRSILSNKNAVTDGTKQYIQDKLKAAAWLIKSIHQRQRTIYRVTKSIVHFQRKFFDKGVVHLKPLVLRDVAEDIQMHESTVSRVTTNKYVHTPQGVFELKYFFDSSINSMVGDSVASESVKEHIKNIVKSENKFKPCSDQDIANYLKNFNIMVARRTVAKYREILGILPSRKRKKPYWTSANLT
jgi:RNA polymerase sigma-54 factor